MVKGRCLHTPVNSMPFFTLTQMALNVMKPGTADPFLGNYITQPITPDQTPAWLSTSAPGSATILKLFMSQLFSGLCAIYMKQKPKVSFSDHHLKSHQTCRFRQKSMYASSFHLNTTINTTFLPLKLYEDSAACTVLATNPARFKPFTKHVTIK